MKGLNVKFLESEKENDDVDDDDFVLKKKYIQTWALKEEKTLEMHLLWLHLHLREELSADYEEPQASTF